MKTLHNTRATALRLVSSARRIGIISAAVLLPLCLLRDLSSLSAGSVIGTCGTAYTALFMAVRCFDRSYAPGGAREQLIAPAMRPAFAAAAGLADGL